MIAPTLTGISVVGILAIIALVYFSEKTIEKVVTLTKYWGLSSTFVGLTIFSVATSLPEFFSGVVASTGILQGSLDYAVGSATIVGANVGSDIFQQTIVLAVAILFYGKLHFSKGFTLTAFIPMIAGAVLTLILALDGTLTRLDGLLLLSVFALYIWMLYHRQESHVEPKEIEADARLVEDSLLAVLYLSLMLVSAYFLLSSAEDFVALTGLGGSLVGAVTLGIAGASPELFTAYTAARRKEEGVGLGVLIGSSIINPVLALGTGAAISTYAVPQPVIKWDIPLKIASSLILLAYLWSTAPDKKRSWWRIPNGNLTKPVSIYLVMVYLVFLYVRWTYLPIDF